MKRSIIYWSVVLLSTTWMFSCGDRAAQVQRITAGQQQSEQSNQAKEASRDIATTSVAVAPKDSTKNDSATVAKPTQATTPRKQQEETAPTEEHSNETATTLDLEKTAILLGGICFVFLVLIGWVYWANRQTILRLRDYVFRNVGAGARNVPKEDISQQIANLQRQIQDQKAATDRLQNTMSGSYGAQSVQHPPTHPLVAEQPQQRVFYFVNPNPEIRGFISRSASPNYLSGQTCYKLTVNKDNTSAVVDFCADNCIDAINMPDLYIDPVCSTQGVRTQHTTRIVPISSGTATLQGGNWIMNTKIIVKYE